MARRDVKSPPALVLAIAEGLTQADAAEAAGVSLRTVQRRQHDPQFRREVVELRSRMLSQTAGRLASKAPAVADALADIALDPQAPIFARISAGIAVMAQNSKYSEIVDLATRLSEVEARLDEQAEA